MWIFHAELCKSKNLLFIDCFYEVIPGYAIAWDEQLVSSDFNHDPHSSIVDLSLTKVIDKKMAKISAWYDNEWGFANRMCDLAVYLGNLK